MAIEEEEERQIALLAIAFVRLALQEDLSLEQINETANFMLDDLDPDQIATLLFQTAGLTARILNAWHSMLIHAVPKEHHDLISSPEQLLDELVALVVTEPTEEEPTEDDPGP
jgi:hypothetical protein